MIGSPNQQHHPGLTSMVWEAISISALFRRLLCYAALHARSALAHPLLQLLLGLPNLQQSSAESEQTNHVKNYTGKKWGALEKEERRR